MSINFDTQDSRVKSGMSVSAAIITDTKQDVLVALNSAIKSQGNAYYIEMFDSSLLSPSGTQANQGVPSATLPRQQSVEVGLSDDTQTEIISGVKEGDQIVVRTIAASAATAQTAPSASSLLRGGGGGR